MKKNLFYAAIAILTMASCTSNDFVGDQEALETGSTKAISFGFDVPAPTRAGGADAATALGNQFIVYGEKNETPETAATAAGASGRDGHLVFPNYQVNWVNNAFSTTSNTHGWEYVGYTHSSNYQSHIQTCANPTAETPTLVNASNAVQTIKFWDNAATSYTFTAVSAAKQLSNSKTDIENGYVTIQKNTTGATVYDKGYKITATADADLSTLYISDRVNNTTKTSPVTLTFRNVLSQIRVGIYETVPGYGISSITFYVNTSGGSPTQTQAALVSTNKAFGAVCPNTMATGAHTLTVTYGDGSTFTENQPIITSSVASTNNLILGTNTNGLSTSNLLGTSATSPTWDTAGEAFTAVFPQINNTTNLSLKCDYTLYNSSTGETIEIAGKTATVPAKYLQWKPNFKYTYLFKITDDALSPITFDAVTIEAEDGTAEYITTVSEPSITTFGVNSTTGKYTTGKDEYEVGSDIYATITKIGSVVTPTLGTNVNVYVATTSDANFPVTEASVAESLANPSAPGKKITVTSINSDATTYFTAVPAKATEVPREDGGYISTSVDLTSQPGGWPTGYYKDERCMTAAPSEYANGTYYQKWTDALKLTGVKNPNTPTYYVIEFIDTSDSNKKYYKVIKVITTT